MKTLKDRQVQKFPKVQTAQLDWSPVCLPHDFMLSPFLWGYIACSRDTKMGWAWPRSWEKVRFMRKGPVLANFLNISQYLEYNSAHEWVSEGMNQWISVSMVSASQKIWNARHVCGKKMVCLGKALLAGEMSEQRWGCKKARGGTRRESHWQRQWRGGKKVEGRTGLRLRRTLSDQLRNVKIKVRHF